MSINWQDIGLVLLGLVCGGLGWFLRQLWDAVANLKSDITDLERDMRQNFARRDDVRDMFDKIMQAIDRVHDELRSKVDK